MQNQGITTPGEPGNPSEVVEDRTTSTTPTMPTTKSPVTQDPTTTTTREEDKNISLNLSIGNDTSSKVTISIKINGNEVYNNGINGSNTGTPVLDSKSISIAQGEFTILVADSVGRTTTKKLNTKDGNYISVLSGLKDININQSNEPFQYL
ncbi:MAG: hypothetical protein UR93_C0029G0013 [Berkelbacteria bacterium GW2011_GWA2_35_9]|uniref:Uncharacterized protein n=1 Tax=Berkelbacteria bacterium GW2011_GWA2_35_9 TaxID=1618333 RepID=A0A0G0G836_9BACT|nr:MAG: hypothetical protein UR93_C0029G0013 [Berkelbacteria bacterium GW2011_GWA2_35_9]